MEECKTRCEIVAHERRFVGLLPCCNELRGVTRCESTRRVATEGRARSRRLTAAIAATTASGGFVYARHVTAPRPSRCRVLRCNPVSGAASRRTRSWLSWPRVSVAGPHRHHGLAEHEAARRLPQWRWWVLRPSLAVARPVRGCGV